MIVLVGIDYSELSARALQLAVLQVKREPGSVVHALAVAEGHGPRLPEELMHEEKQQFLADSQRTLGEYIAAQAPELAALGVTLVPHVRLGAPAAELVAAAAEVGAELIVVGTHGRKGLARMTLGSVAEHVVRNAHCPVLVAR